MRCRHVRKKALRRALSATEPWSSTLLAVEAHRAGLRLGLTPESVDLRLAIVTFMLLRPEGLIPSSRRRAELHEEDDTTQEHLAEVAPE